MAVAVVMNQVAVDYLLCSQSFPHVCKENPQLMKTGRVVVNYPIHQGPQAWDREWELQKMEFELLWSEIWDL